MSKNSQTSNENKPDVIAIVGATASGKTAYSIELAKEIDGEIISADSRLVYKGFNIGAAKPTIEERQGIPHYMIDIVEPDFEYSAGLYKQQAKKIINDIIKRGKTPIIAGGTGLYIDILLKNYDLPEIPADRPLRDELKKYTKDDLYNKLLELDSDAGEIIDKNDSKKIIRAIEIIKTTGKSLKNSRGIKPSEYNIKWIGKNFDRKTLYERIDKRVDIMVENGLVEETKGLLDKYGDIPNITSTIGYREISGYLYDKYSLEEGIALLKKNTRNYAKRQLTWFRKNPDIIWDVYPEKLKK